MMSLQKNVELKHSTSYTYDGYNEKTATYSTSYIDVTETTIKVERNDNDQHVFAIDHTYAYYGSTTVYAGDIIDGNTIYLVKQAPFIGVPTLIYAKEVSA